jgi:hypothetical protein
MAVEPCVVDVEPIGAEGSLPVVEAPPLLIGERRTLGGADAGAVVLADDRRHIVLPILDPGVATAGEVRRD